MKFKNLFSTRALSLVNLTWRGALESPRVMKSRFKTLILSLTDGLTKEWCIATHLFWVACRSIAKKSGWLFLALYIKQARVCLLRFCGGMSPPQTLAPAVSLTRSGIPRIIPSFHRRRIKERDPEIIRLYLSLFSVSKLIPLAKKVDSALFKSLSSPAPIEQVKEVVSRMREHIPKLIRRYIPQVSSIPLFQGIEFTPTWKSVPSSAWYKRLLRKSGDSQGKSLRSYSYKTSLFPCFFSELGAFTTLMNFVHVRGEQYSQGCLWPPYIRFAFDRQVNKMITFWSLDWFERRVGPVLPSSEQLGIPPNTGRLCCACTGDGKRRLFAVGNYINQRLLYPMHQWLAQLLRSIVMDGTFDQLAPLDRLAGVLGEVHSIDLKSATDRWPLVLLFELVQALFDRSFASSVVNSALACNIFEIAFVKKKLTKTISFVAGQPLGYYSSWPLFALSHHLVVWYAAEQEYPGRKFDKYAVLGDDIVIADAAVSARYRLCIDQLGVSISEGKSLVSPSGACEFAKRFRLDRMTLDVSPLSLKKISAARSPIGWYNLFTGLPRRVRVSTALRIGGLGFKAASRPIRSLKHGKRAKRMVAMLLMQYTANMSVWLGLSVVLGFWVQPQVIGRIYWSLMEHFAPKDLVLPPPEVFPYPGMMEFQEYSTFRGWMKQYLNYLKWYALLNLNPGTLDDFFNAPVYIRTWFAPGVDLSTFRFGVSFRIVDWASRLSLEVIPLLTESSNEPSDTADNRIEDH